MIWKENECVGCPPDWGCLGNACPNRTIRMECDHCHEEVDKLFWFQGEQWCAECVLEEYDEVVIEKELEE